MKKYLLSVIALLLAVGFTAFTSGKLKPQNKFQTQTWILNDQSQASDATYRSTKANYHSTTDFTCTPDLVQVCKVRVEGDGASPERPNFVDNGPNDDIRDALFANSALPDKVFIKP